MTLLDTLNQLMAKGVPTVKIRSKGGSSYFYADTLDNNIFETIEKISDNYIANYRNTLREKRKQFNNLDAHYENIIEKEKKVRDPLWVSMQLAKLPENERKSAKNKYTKRANNLEKRIASFERKREELRVSLPIKIAQLDNLVKTFTPLLTREVYEVYDTILTYEEGNKNITIYGLENGQFWTIQEYRDYIEEQKKIAKEQRNKLEEKAKKKLDKLEKQKALSIGAFVEKTEKELEKEEKEKERLRNLWIKEQQVK